MCLFVLVVVVVVVVVAVVVIIVYIIFGRHDLPHAACLMRPRFFYALFVVSRIIVICYIVCHF